MTEENKVEDSPSLSTLVKPERRDTEAFEDYKVRRSSAKKIINNYIKNGTMFYETNKNNRKPYRKPKE